MAAFPNLPRDLAGRINDLGNLSYMRHEGETVLRRDVLFLSDCTLTELNRRQLIQRSNIRQALEDDGDEPSEATLGMCGDYATLCDNERFIRRAFESILEDHEAFFEANRSSGPTSLVAIRREPAALRARLTQSELE
jgi:hypothetical protein